MTASTKFPKGTFVTCFLYQFRFDINRFRVKRVVPDTTKIALSPDFNERWLRCLVFVKQDHGHVESLVRMRARLKVWEERFRLARNRQPASRLIRFKIGPVACCFTDIVQQKPLH